MAYTTPAQSRAIIVNAADSQALSFTSTPGVGSLILVAISSWQGDLGTSAVSDNQSNTYTRVPKSEWDTDADVALFWAVATTSSGTFTITVNPTGSSCDFTFCIMEFQGNASSPYDTAVTATGSTLNVSTGNITPGQNNCLWVAVMAHTGTDRTISPVNGTQIYENEGGSSNMPLSVTYKVQTTATAEAATWTLGSDCGWGALVASFKPSSGGTALTIANATQAQTADNATLTAYDPPAHTFDTSARIPSSGTSTSNPVTGSYTCGAGATVLVVMLKYANSTDRTGGAPTYNGIALTQADIVRKAASSPEGCAELWYLLDPPTGASYTISIPNSNTKTVVAYVASAKVNTAGYSSRLDVAGGNTGTSTNPTASVTTTVYGDILFAVVFNGATTWAPSGRTGTQIGDSDDGAWGGGAQYYIKTGTGSQAMAWTFGTSDDWGECVAAFKVQQVLTIANAAQTQAADNLDLTQHNILAIDNAAQAQTADNTALTQHNILTIASATQAQTADNTALTQHNILTIASATQAQAADNLTVTYHPSSTVSLSIADAAQAQTAEALALTQHNVLTIASAAQAQTADNTALIQHNVLTVADAAQAQTADNLTVTYHAPGGVSLTIADASQAQTADNLTLTQHHTLAIANADQAQTAGEPALTQHNALAIANAVQIQTAGELALIQHNTLAIANATHSQTADGISCTQHQILVIADANQSQAADNLTLVHHRVTTITPDWRIYRVEAEIRTYLIEAEDRKIPIAAENRTYSIEPENRTLAIQAEDRTYRVERIGYEDD